jgi:CheY-like chemotaxis protein
VCDDEEPLRQLVRETLEPTSCEVVDAPDGDQAIALARSLRPAVILLDMMMPGRTGLDVATELRADPEFADTPIVFLSARVQASDRAAASNSGADHFLPKPFSIFDLIALVGRLLEEQK